VLKEKETKIKIYRLSQFMDKRLELGRKPQ